MAVDTVKLYTKGSRVWLGDKEEVWKGGVVVSYAPGENIVVSDPETGKELHIVLKEGKSMMPPLRNPDILTMENNLTTMSYLHEPAVLHSLYQRFTISNNIYTYCGIVLVAVNPYCDVQLYGNEMIWAYKGQQIGQLDPHIYAISEDAYSEMKTMGRNQSIIVSGESGAGKTVSAKYAMRYFATVAGNEKETAIERRILSTNPIMEALGNAKTIRNDNSSRFGKYVELEFDKQTNISGAHICTYLLEKSRVVFQANNERNYHIFYQLCAVRDIPEMKHLHLKHPDEFRFTSQGKAPVIDNMDDSETFYEMSEGLFNLGITEEQQLFLFSVLAAVLHMGDIQFNEERNDSCSISNDDKSLLIAAKLMGLEVAQLQKWLCHKTLKARNETLVMTLKKKDAFAGMEAFVKHIYASLFLWIVKLLNAALSNGKKDAVNFIGILDIYGFEMFEENSFEQFCINYANEKLQQQFNQHVFKLEQAEYIKEQIKWSFIDFTDNQPCIDLIEKKLGIIDLLDEQCRMNRGTDENWVQILYKELTDSEHFQKPKTGTDQFVIVHYADKVSYLCHGFIAKNLDSVNESHINLLKNSSLELANEALGGSDLGSITSPKRVATKSLSRRGTTQTLSKTRTVGAQFKSSLNLLMDALTTTVPHFIRCIKPNDDKEPFGFVPTRVVQQLRACGVIETVRISAAGYPSRWSYKEFESRYSLLVHSRRVRKGETMDNCRVVISSIVSDKDKYQFGKTKIFFRAGQVAYFEKLRSERLFSACVMVQARVRGWLAAKRYNSVRVATIAVQCMVRRTLARRKVQKMRENRASIVIQKHVRGWVQRIKYRRLLVSILFIQSAHRAQVAYKNFLTVKYEHNAKIIQKHVRGWLARCAYKQHMRKIIQIQSCVRRHLAKKKLKALKVEARSIGHFKKLNVKLEKRIFEMQMKSKDMVKERNSVLEETKQNLEELAAVKKKLGEESRSREELEKELSTTTDELKDIRQNYLAMKLEIARRTREEEDIEELKARIQELETEVKQSKEETVSERNNGEERYAALERSMNAQIEVEREHHQNMLIENGNLQRQLQELQELTHGQWQDSSDDRDDLSSVMSDVPPDSGVLSSGITSPAVGFPPHDPRARVADLENIREKLEEQLATANKTIAELKETGASTGAPIVVNGGDKIFPVDENERARLEEIIIENVELKENLDRMTDDLMDAIDEQTLMRTKYEQMELKLSNVKDSLLREIVNTRNPRQAQDKIRSHLDSLRVELFSDVAKFNKNNIKTEEDAVLQSKVETLAGENIKLLDDINRLQNAIPFISGNTEKKLEKKLTRQESLSTIRSRKQEFKGMFACKKGDDSKLVKRLITQLKTEHVTGPGCMSGLTAHIMFMCVRYADHCNDEGRIQELLTAIISGITSVTRKQSRDPVISTFWLTNCLTLLHDLTQFSGEELYHNRLSPAMRDFALKNYDLSDYRPLLSDQCINIYHTIVKTAQDELQPMLIPGMLEHDSIPGMNSSFSGGRKQTDKGCDTGVIVNRLQFYLQLLSSQSISINIVRQFIGQLLYFINATLLNNLILRKDLCHWSKGIQIRYNLSQVEQWVREQGLDLDDSGVLTYLSEIRQASQLLQMNKSSGDNAAAIVETCYSLNTMQLQKLLMLYSPRSEFEERVPQDVIKYILNHKPIEKSQKLMMDPNKLHALKFSYETRDIDFTIVTLPSGLKVDFLEKY
ncbi:unconventional myosin-Va-like isoform X5 [Bolinopsis microptera]|uniref:unconventional myosin-Va-like isoform X5 n=1 Tax=Bolinopsis microptera TaxID=2820187 RepID=UPI00307987FD